MQEGTDIKLTSNSHTSVLTGKKFFCIYPIKEQETILHDVSNQIHN